MPKKRARILLIFAVILYLLANQTQVGWVYIISSAILGVLVTAFLYARNVLKSIQLERRLETISDKLENNTGSAMQSSPETMLNDLFTATATFHEDDPIMVTLHLRKTKARPAFLISGQEYCPFAAQADQSQPFFIPALFRQQPVELTYQTNCDRRGLHTFPDISLSTSGPFGLFSSRATVTEPTSILIYPQYYPLKRLRIFEKSAFAERQSLRHGISNQVIGTREYRPGDTLRQIHWRSTARIGDLIVKEFSEDEQLTMTVVLDLHRQGSVGQGKFSSFETAVRIAASLAYYASENKIPYHLAGSSLNHEPPLTALSWWSSLAYLAKVQNDGQTSLEQVIAKHSGGTFVIVLVSNLTASIVHYLQRQTAQNVHLFPIFITSDGGLPPAANGLRLALTVSPHNWMEKLGNL